MEPKQKAQEQSDVILKRTIIELTERNKELNCLYGISRIIEQWDNSLDEILQRVVEILPQAFQHPQKTCARIVLDNQTFNSIPFSETAWLLKSDLLVKESFAGSVEIYRLKNGIESDETSFLKGEKDLLESVAERLGKVILRHRIERGLQRSEKRFRKLVEDSITGISIVQDNQIIYQNPVQEKLLGPLPRTHVLGDFENIYPDDVDTVMQVSRDIQMGKLPGYDLDFRLFPASDDTGNRTVKRVLCRVLLIDYQGKESILVNMIDMTKILELEQLLFKQDKMASLGRVAAGIAHEIRNPLSGINIYLNALEKMVDRPDSGLKVHQVIGQLQSASRKIESVIKKVMDFAKPGEPKFTLIKINKPVEDALNLTAVTLRKSSIGIHKDLDENVPAIYADPHLIEEAVLNLINNAAQAMYEMESDKKIAIKTGVTGDHIFIKISDAGPGVPMDLRNKVFDPFFTTKNDGTGIGLSICHRIAADHKGVLVVSEGNLGGAEFRLDIPIRKDALTSD